VIHFIVFSYNRPLQLHAYLTSLADQLRGTAEVDVLVRADPAYQAAYNELALEFSYVNFVIEHDFASQMGGLIKNITAEYVCFGCDDVIFQQPVDEDEVANLLNDERIIGVSFRLGSHVTFGIFWQLQPQPAFEPVGQFLTWNMDDAIDDWRYPWDVLGTIYRADLVREMWPSIRTARNPSQFEDQGSRAWRTVTDQRRYACWNQARAVVPTPNVVQDEFPNGYIGQIALDAEFLLHCWQHHMRIDLDRYYAAVWPGWRIGDFYLKRQSS